MPVRQRKTLDSTWDFLLDSAGELKARSLPEAGWRKVKVPAPWQSQGEDLRFATGAGWYRRSFDLPPEWLGSAVVLGFGAVDYFAQVWLNGVFQGKHEGGYLPFELDVTAAAQKGKNTLLVRVDDPLDLFPEIPHGKQSWYGPVSGLWQTVWIEARPAQHLCGLRVTPQVLTGTDDWQVQVEVEVNTPLNDQQQIRIQLFDPMMDLKVETIGRELIQTLSIRSPQLWDLWEPHLYRIQAELLGRESDLISDTFGFRTIETGNGHILLNGKPVYLRGALDQDYYPDLIATPPSEEFLDRQFRQAQHLGLNCLRIHIKVADPRYYAAADRAGLLIWTELPNWQTLTPEARRRARETLEGMVLRDWNHPSIIAWTVINESWGVDLTDPEHRQFAAEMYGFLKGLDPTRIAVGNSACWGNAQVATDLADFHNYYAMPDRYQKWRRWVERYAARPEWIFARPYSGYKDWKRFLRNPWVPPAIERAQEVVCRGDEPLVVSEFGNWGLPDVDALVDHYQGEPWWFETGFDWGQGVAYPHNLEGRFRAYHLERTFNDLNDLISASQELQFAALKYQIEQMRRHSGISGYVITEFTDVHWEANGLLDMLRQPKSFYDRFASINADDVIVPDWKRLAYRSGEQVRVNLSISHYSRKNLSGSRLVWRVVAQPGLEGVLDGLVIERYAANRLGRLSFRAPRVVQPTRARLELRLIADDGGLVAENFLELFFFPPAEPPTNLLPIYAPGMEVALEKLGYRLAPEQGSAGVVAATVLDDHLREYLLGGGRVLFLAETTKSQQTHLGNVKVLPRHKRVWQGDWASSLSWIYSDRLFPDLPTGGLVDFAFAGLTPEHVITGLGQHEFANQVHAALAVGWLHNTTALVAERAVGRGRLMICTFRLSRSLGKNPMADFLFRRMVERLNAP